MDYMTQSYPQRQAALEAAKAAFLQQGGQIIVLGTIRRDVGGEFNGTFAQPDPAEKKAVSSDEALAQRLRKEAAAGHCMSRAAANLSLHRKKVKRVASLFGIVFPPGTHTNADKARAAKAGGKDDERDGERLREYAAQGICLSAAAKLMGYGCTRVQRLAELYNIEFRPGGTRQ